MINLETLRRKTSPKPALSLQSVNTLQTHDSESIPIRKEIREVFIHLKDDKSVSFKKSDLTKEQLPLKVGIIFSGGPAAGGLNVIVGLYHSLMQFHKDSELIGFLNGPIGIIENHFKPISNEDIQSIQNQGGFTLIGSGRMKIDSLDQFASCLSTVNKNDLDGLVIVGGDDSNTNAAYLADFFLKNQCKTKVIGVPKTIDGDLKNHWIEASFGFDSATKTYSELIGNILVDANSQDKYYFFAKLMGRTASHIVLECALKTHPHLSFISEEIQSSNISLEQIVDEIVNLVIERHLKGKNHGVILIPEGIIEFIPEFSELIKELNADPDNLSQKSNALLKQLPEKIKNQLLLDRDPHGNIQVSKIETERLLIDLVTKELKKDSRYKGNFSAQPLFFGYEGRCCLPSSFDSNYCYNLGFVASLLIANRMTGFMAILRGLENDVRDWEPFGVPLIAMMDMEERKGTLTPVIQKGLVDLEGRPFQFFKENRLHWQQNEDYQVPGPIQFFGPKEIVDQITITLALEKTFNV